jgi:hypothetical protein
MSEKPISPLRGRMPKRRIHITFVRLMACPRFCTIRDVWRGARGRKAKRPRTPVWISSSPGTARSRLFMFTSTRRPHNARAEPCIGVLGQTLPKCDARATSAFPSKATA